VPGSLEGGQQLLLDRVQHALGNGQCFTCVAEPADALLSLELADARNDALNRRADAAAVFDRKRQLSNRSAHVIRHRSLAKAIGLRLEALQNTHGRECVFVQGCHGVPSGRSADAARGRKNS
jgi:hypothetical protein